MNVSKCDICKKKHKLFKEEKNKMKNKKSGRMTIDKLAIMMNNSFENLEKKMATKDDLKDLETRMNGKFEGVNK